MNVENKAEEDELKRNKVRKVGIKCDKSRTEKRILKRCSFLPIFLLSLFNLIIKFFHLHPINSFVMFVNIKISRRNKII